MVKNFEQTLRKSAQICKSHIARGYLWGKVNQTNLDAQKILFKYTCLNHRAHTFQPFAPARDASHVCERVTIKHPVSMSKSLASKKKLGTQSNDMATQINNHPCWRKGKQVICRGTHRHGLPATVQTTSIPLRWEGLLVNHTNVQSCH